MIKLEKQCWRFALTRDTSVNFPVFLSFSRGPLTLPAVVFRSDIRWTSVDSKHGTVFASRFHWTLMSYLAHQNVSHIDRFWQVEMDIAIRGVARIFQGGATWAIRIVDVLELAAFYVWLLHSLKIMAYYWHLFVAVVFSGTLLYQNCHESTQNRSQHCQSRFQFHKQFLCSNFVLQRATEFQKLISKNEIEVIDRSQIVGVNQAWLLAFLLTNLWNFISRLSFFGARFVE